MTPASQEHSPCDPRPDAAGTPRPAPPAEPPAPGTELAGTVIAISGAHLRVATPHGEYHTWLGGRFKQGKRRERTPVVVGDRVTIAIEATTQREAALVAIAPRRTVLTRPAPRGKGRLSHTVVANADQLLIVVPVDESGFLINLIDRFLVAAERGALTAALAINKIDRAGAPGCVSQATAEDVARLYRSLGVPVALTSATSGAGLEALRGVLQDKATVIAGQSGVGKSTLLNRLVPGLQRPTRAINQKTGRGTHVTSTATRFELPGGGALIDTPGVREFGFIELDPRDVYKYYVELEPLGDACAYRDCSHQEGARGCLVLEALAAGTIDARRYQSYVALTESLADAT